MRLRGKKVIIRMVFYSSFSRVGGRRITGKGGKVTPGRRGYCRRRFRRAIKCGKKARDNRRDRNFYQASQKRVFRALIPRLQIQYTEYNGAEAHVASLLRDNMNAIQQLQHSMNVIHDTDGNS
uniref:Transposase n=1 Tax=Strongyloides papillosus TaxID=174720 RepID=A0A0N5BIH8_STREA